MKFQVISTDQDRIRQDTDERLCRGEMERIGIDIVTDGEMRRESYSNYFSLALEGVDSEHLGAVIGANVVITSSTPILDVTGPAEKVIKGRVPARSVVVPGTRPKQFPAGTYQLPCALIIGQRSASTDRKTSLTEVLRQFSIPA